MSDTIEVFEGHEVTVAAISCNIGSGLLEAMKIDPHAYASGSVVDVLVRMRIGEITHKPVKADDADGPWKRIHKAVPLAAVPTTLENVGRVIDAHLAKVSKRRELPGQSSIDDEIDRKRKDKAAKKAAKTPGKKAPAKKPSKPKAVKETPTDAAATGEGF